MVRVLRDERNQLHALSVQSLRRNKRKKDVPDSHRHRISPSIFRNQRTLGETVAGRMVCRWVDLADGAQRSWGRCSSSKLAK
jgi:hypothetical protein